MEAAEERRRLVAMIRRLLEDLESHGSDYHHVTPRALLEEARSLLREAEQGAGSGGP